MIEVKQIYNKFARVLFFLTILIVSVTECRDKHFVFISASYNNAKWCERSLQSVFMQEYQNWSMIYIDDCSTDGMGNLVEQYVADHGMQDRVVIIHNPERMGHCYNQYHAIHSCDDDVIIVILDGDDWLAHNQVLHNLNNAYQQDIWITYGQFRRARKNIMGFCKEIPKSVIQNNSIRDYSQWITSHMRTFYAGLYKKIKLEDLMYQEKFLPMAVDQATMLPMIEMAGERSKFISEVVYIYNDMNALNFYREKIELQKQITQMVRNLPKYQLLTDPPF